MAKFISTKKKIRDSWRRAEFTNIIYQQKLLVQEDLVAKVAANDRAISPNKLLIDMSTEWQLVNTSETESTLYEARIEFLRMNIDWIPYVRIAFLYAHGDPKSDLYTAIDDPNNIGITQSDFNKFVKLEDIKGEKATSKIKKITIVAGLLNGFPTTPAAVYVKTQVQFINPKEYI